MPPVLPHALANGQVVDLDKVYADLLALVAYLSGNALGSDFLAASIPNSRLANKYVPISVVDRITKPGLNSYYDGDDDDEGTWYDAVAGPPTLRDTVFNDTYARNLTMWRAPYGCTIEAAWCQTFSGGEFGTCQLWRKTLAGAWFVLAGTTLDIKTADPSVVGGNVVTGLALSIYQGDLLAWRTDAVFTEALLPLVVGFSGKAELQA